MSLPTASVLKSYFDTGCHPTAAQFGELIDALFALHQDALSQAQAPVALAALQSQAKFATLLVSSAENGRACAIVGQFPAQDLTVSWLRCESGQQVFRLTFASVLLAGDQARVNHSDGVAWTILATDGASLDFGLPDSTPVGQLLHFAIT